METQVTLNQIETLLCKALDKIRKVNNPSEQVSGLGLVNRASKLGKQYAEKYAEEKARVRFERMQDHKLRYFKFLESKAAKEAK